MTPCKFVSALSTEDQAALVQMHLCGPTPRQRQRAHAVLLSAKGYTLDQLADILGTGRDTVSGWLNQWQARGLDGLADAVKSGRPRAMDAAIEAELRALIENPTPDLKALVQAHLKKKTTVPPGTP
jgi:transposase